jgi:competence protein ComEC
MNWREFPMARLLLPLILGILIGNFWGIGRINNAWLLLLVICVLALAVMQVPLSYIRRWWYGIVLNLFLLAAGYFLCAHQQVRPPIPLDKNVLLGEIIQLSESAQKRRLLLQTFDQVSQSENTKKTEAKVLVYLDKSVKSESLKIGDHLLCRGKLSPIPPPLNPHAFDYQAYMANQGVYYQTFITEEGWQYLGYRNSLFRVADSWRTYFLSILKAHLTGINEYAVGAALSLGYKSAITDELRTAYANTGAMHVLAVSGLHVGLVQLIISWLLNFIRLNSQYWSLIKALLTIVGIWSFALLAGGAPSVLRAATMFSFLAAGLALKRYSNIYNSLASSAFLLLCIQPNLLFSVGFQLSYLAVLGIVYFQPRLYRLWYIKYKAVDYVWKLTTVSIAAQLATLPISIYYFHQFPIYFFLSGLVVVPAAALVLMLSISLFAFHGLPLIAFIIGRFLNGLLQIVNNVIFFIQQLPAGLLEGIWVSTTSVIIMYALLLTVIIAINTRKDIYLRYALMISLLLAFTYSHRQWEVNKQRALVVYQVKGKSLVDYFAGQKCYSLAANDINSNDIKYTAQQHRWYRRVRAIHCIPQDSTLTDIALWAYNGFMQIGELKMVLPQHITVPASDSLPLLHVDLLLLTKDANVDLEKWSQYLKPEQVVIDGSTSYYEAMEWIDSCKKLDWPVHYTKYDGAFIINKADL